MKIMKENHSVTAKYKLLNNTVLNDISFKYESYKLYTEIKSPCDGKNINF